MSKFLYPTTFMRISMPTLIQPKKSCHTPTLQITHEYNIYYNHQNKSQMFNNLCIIYTERFRNYISAFQTKIHAWPKQSVLHSPYQKYSIVKCDQKTLNYAICTKLT